MTAIFIFTVFFAVLCDAQSPIRMPVLENSFTIKSVKIDESSLRAYCQLSGLPEDAVRICERDYRIPKNETTSSNSTYEASPRAVHYAVGAVAGWIPIVGSILNAAKMQQIDEALENVSEQVLSLKEMMVENNSRTSIRQTGAQLLECLEQLKVFELCTLVRRNAVDELDLTNREKRLTAHRGIFKVTKITRANNTAVVSMQIRAVKMKDQQNRRVIPDHFAMEHGTAVRKYGRVEYIGRDGIIRVMDSRGTLHEAGPRRVEEIKEPSSLNCQATTIQLWCSQLCLVIHNGQQIERYGLFYWDTVGSSIDLGDQSCVLRPPEGPSSIAIKQYDAEIKFMASVKKNKPLDGFSLVNYILKDYQELMYAPFNFFEKHAALVKILFYVIAVIGWVSFHYIYKKMLVPHCCGGYDVIAKLNHYMWSQFGDYLSGIGKCFYSCVYPMAKCCCTLTSKEFQDHRTETHDKFEEFTIRFNRLESKMDEKPAVCRDIGARREIQEMQRKCPELQNTTAASSEASLFDYAHDESVAQKPPRYTTRTDLINHGIV